MGVGVTELFFIAALAVLPAIAVGKIASKAGLSRWLGLTQLLPGISLIGLLYIAFTEWPVSLRRDKEL